MQVLDGKKASAHIRAEVAREAAELAAKAGRKPCLAVILAGDDPASQVYVKNKEKGCAEANIESRPYRLPASVSQDELLELVDQLNADDAVDGILLQLPLPAGIDSQVCLERILPDKDVDGFHPVNMGRLVLGLPGLRPCTPAGVMKLLELNGLSPAGKRSVVVGRSNIVGKPLAVMLGAPGKHANSTVTVCHSGTPNLAETCREADFLFVAMGRPKFVTADMVKKGAVVVDVGIHRTAAGLCGDCDYEGISEIASAMTPVPGGVGPMTIAMLLRNTVTAFRRHIGEE